MKSSSKNKRTKSLLKRSNPMTVNEIIEENPLIVIDSLRPDERIKYIKNKNAIESARKSAMDHHMTDINTTIMTHPAISIPDNYELSKANLIELYNRPKLLSRKHDLDTEKYNKEIDDVNDAWNVNWNTKEPREKREKIRELYNLSKSLEASYNASIYSINRDIRINQVFMQKYMFNYPDIPSYLEIQLIDLCREFPQVETKVAEVLQESKRIWMDQKYRLLRNQITMIKIIGSLGAIPLQGVMPTTEIEEMYFSLQKYTDEGHNKDLANYMNKNIILSDEEIAFLDKLIKGLHLCFKYIEPICGNIMVYRGTRLPSYIQNQELNGSTRLEKYRNKIISNKTFLSTSLSQIEASTYTKQGTGIMIQIQILEDSKCLPVISFNLDDNNEIILQDYYNRNYSEPEHFDRHDIGKNIYTYTDNIDDTPTVNFIEILKIHLIKKYSCKKDAGCTILGGNKKLHLLTHKSKKNKNKNKKIKYKSKKNKNKKIKYKSKTVKIT